MKITKLDEGYQLDLLERKWQLLHELDRLESERRSMGARLAAMVGGPALVLAILVPTIWSPPHWLLICLTLLLFGTPVVSVLGTGEGRASRATWHRIEHLKRELRFFESFGHFNE